MNDNNDVPNYDPNLNSEDTDTIFTVKYWKRTADRAVKTFVYTMLVTLAGPAIVGSTDAAGGLVSDAAGGLVSVPWQGALSASVAATLLSLGGSLVGRKLGGNSADPAWVNTQ